MIPSPRRLALVIPLALIACAEPVPPSVSRDLLADVSDRLESGEWTQPPATEIEVVRIAGRSKRSLVITAGFSAELPPVDVEPGSTLRFELGIAHRDGRARGPCRLRVEVVTGADATERVEPIFEETVTPARNRGGDRWSAATRVLEGADDLRLRLHVEPAGETSGQGSAPALAIGDLALLAPGSGEHRKNVLLISLDTLRADHLSFYGYHDETSVFLSELVDRMVVYENAFTSSTWTLPSHSAVFTGLYPSEHGAISQSGDLPGSRLPDDVHTLAEVLQREGYLTMGIATASPLNRRFGVDQGFVLFADDLRPADEINQLAFRWLDDLEDQPYFLFLNYFDVHLPLDPPDYPDDDRELLEASGINFKRWQWAHMRKAGQDSLSPEVLDALRKRYDAEIRWTDGMLRELFDGLEERGLLADTVVCIFADHGESFGEHDRYGHGGPFHQAQAHVPLAYLDPERPGTDRTVDDPVSTVEIASWIARDLGLKDVPPGMKPGKRPVYGARYIGTGSWRMYFDGRYKYLVTFRDERGRIVREDEEIYDLREDPVESTNLAGGDAALLERLRGELDELIATSGIAGPERKADPPQNATEADRALQEELRAMGYVGDE